MTKFAMREKSEPQVPKTKVRAEPKDTLFRDIALGLLIGLLIVVIILL